MRAFDMQAPERSLPDPQVCEQARLSRDARFDGLFYTAVKTTRIYCRPMCPAPAPKAANVIYFQHPAAAEAAGYRPCLRCRPELSPAEGSWRRGDAVVARALKLIDGGALADAPLASLAERLGTGERHLRRLFADRLGAPPTGVHNTRRLLFAKQLLTETCLPITEVALAAGFGSIRRFNAAFLESYRLAPRDLRRQAVAPSGDALTLRLSYRPPHDFTGMLGFLRGRSLPGVEVVGDESYQRVIGPIDDGAPHAPGWLRVSPWPNGEPALKLELHNAPPSQLLEIVGRVRRMFDLDADPRAIAHALSHSERLRPLVETNPGVRVPSGWDGFEIAVRAILGQQISVAAARTLAARVAQRYGQPAPESFGEAGLTHLFPSPHALADASLTDIGLTRARADTVRTVARALLDGRVDFRPEQTLDEFATRWVALPGIGPWTAQYIAMRALGHPDALPAEDLVLQRFAALDGSVLTAKQLRALSEQWRPWRAYAVIHLWRDAAARMAESKRGAQVRAAA